MSERTVWPGLIHASTMLLLSLRDLQFRAIHENWLLSYHSRNITSMIALTYNLSVICLWVLLSFSLEWFDFK